MSLKIKRGIMSEVEFRNKIKSHIEGITNAQGIYDLFKLLNYPRKSIFDPSYIRKLSDFELAKDEKNKVKKIFTIMSFDKLNVFFVESSSLNRPFVRYMTRVFSDMYMQFLLIMTVDYSEFQFILPDYEKKEGGKHKLKTTVLHIKKDELFYTDIEVTSNLYLIDDKLSWRDAWKIWKDAFNVEKVTDKFFEDYKSIFLIIRKELKKQKMDVKVAHEFTLQFLNRIMFVYFVAKKNWLNNDKKFMKTYWTSYKQLNKMGNNEFYTRWLQPLFFEAFNNKGKFHSELPEDINKILANCPYLNGGLFTRKEGLDNLKIIISDTLFKDIFEFFESYNFTIKEDSILDIEVAVDPQMIGYVYESLANVTEDVYEQEEDLRGDWGIYYTPRIEVDFMCRRSIVEYLANRTNLQKNDLYEFVFDEDKEKIEKKFNLANCWDKIEGALDELSVVDPACGSGAFLVGMLNVLIDLYKPIYRKTKTSLTDFEMKYRILQRSLYGVDVMPWAIHAAELRLWLQLIVETQFNEDELRKHPLLPNLNMNLRIGDSLVQEIGGIIFNVRTNNLKSFLKKKLEDLKQEKQKFYECSPTAKYKTVDEFRKIEAGLFTEIINERIESLESDILVLSNSVRRKEKQTGLFGSQINVNAEMIKKEKHNLAKIDENIANCKEEIEKLTKIKLELKDPLKKPFVWDIDFAEIFSDKNGFDIVIGNPPYVRQEMISPPNRIKAEVTLDDRKEYKEKLIQSVQMQFPVIEDLDRKSDYYIYFYFHGLSLLNEKGTFCFITSNSWLDVGYGTELQKFLLKYVPITAIYDNPKRSFAHADVNTIIALFGAPTIKEETVEGFKILGNGWSKLGNIAKFVMFQLPFEEAINSKNLIAIENIKTKVKGKSIIELIENVVKTTDYRIFPIIQEDLMEDGWDYPEGYKNGRFKLGKYDGNKWGGKYLRAPDIFYTILHKGKEKLIELRDISDVKFGIKTGANDFFYLDEKMIKEWKIEPEYLLNIIRTSKEIEFTIIKQQDLKFKLFYCNKPKEELKNTNALKYITYGEHKKIEIKKGGDKGKEVIGYHKLETIKNRKLWYSIGERDYPNFAQTQIFNDRFLFTDTDNTFVDNVLNEIRLKKDYKTIKNKCLSALNCTLSILMIELYGRAALGEGALKLQVNDLKKILLFKPDRLERNIPFKRKVLSIFEELRINEAYPIREQEPKPISDRAELDNIIFDELGLTKEERKEVYWAVCELVKQRLDKAKSLSED